VAESGATKNLILQAFQMPLQVSQNQWLCTLQSAQINIPRNFMRAGFISPAGV
jgi:hypothetical protein